MTDLARLSAALARDDDGIWRPITARQHVLSYPADSNAYCFRLEDESFWFAHRNECIAAALTSGGVVGPLLDVGGGNGAVSQALEQRGIETVVLEPGPDGARNARRRGLQNVVCATLEDARFAPGAFGSVGLFDVIEHVVDERALLREIHRVLRPGGHLALTVPAYSWLWSEADNRDGHHRRYTLSGLAALLGRCSFDVRFQSYFFAPLIAPMLLLRSLPYRLRRASRASSGGDPATEHRPSPVARRVVDALLAPERRLVEQGRSIPFGTSCLVLATRV